MAKPARKIWCPKCHKRHRLPPNAGGLTLRCRGCRFAFRVQDGLTFDPAALQDPAVEAPVEPPSSTPAHYASTEVIPLSESSADPELPIAKPVAPAVVSAAAAESGEIVATVDEDVNGSPATFDHDYDDILDVLETPDSDPIAPPRAHAKTEGALTTIQSGRTVVQAEPEPARRPVTRQQLRAHRNARQFWMLMSFLGACLLGAVCWFGARYLIQPGLSPWERKILFAMGTPARLLPPQADDEEMILPANHVKLRGDHIELADRKALFRDEFPQQNFFNGPGNDRDEEVEDGFAVRRERDNDMAVGPERRQPDPRRDNGRIDGNRAPAQAAPRKNVPRPNAAPRERPRRNDLAERNNNRAQQPGNSRFQSIEAPGVMNGERAARAARPPIGRMNPGPPKNRATRNRGNSRVAKRGNAPRGNSWTPPELQLSDVLRVSRDGIDPKLQKSLSIDTAEPLRIALASGTVFLVGRDRRLSAWDLRTGEKSAEQKLDRDVAAVCSAFENKATSRPEVWLLFGSGKLEKWELRGGRLNKRISVAARAVFKEKTPMVAAGRKLVAYRLEDQVSIVSILEAASKIEETKSVVIGGKVRAMQFSDDESQLLVVVDNKAVLVDARNAEILSENKLPTEMLKGVRVNSCSIRISADLGTLFVCRNGAVESFDLGNSVANGRYWSSAPVPLTGVATYGDRLIGVAGNGSSYAALFSIEAMESAETDVDNRVAKKAEGTRKRRDVMRGDKAADQMGKFPHEIDRSPTLAAPLQSIVALPDNRFAFLTIEREGDRVCIAERGDRWNVTSLKIDAGMKIKGFDISEDGSRVAIHAIDVIQAWRVVDPGKGDAEFVAESVVHTEKITQIKLTNDGKRIVSGDWSGNVFVSGFDSGRRMGSVDGFRNTIKHISARGDSGFVVMNQRGVAKNRGGISPFGAAVNGASALSKNGSKIAGYFGFEVRIANDDGKKILGTVKPKDRPDFISFTNDQKLLLLQSGREISVWDWRKGERLRVFRYSKSVQPAVVPMAVSSDDKTVAVVSGLERNQISIFEMPEIVGK